MNRKSVIPIVGLIAVVLLAPSSYGQIHTSMEGSLPGLKVSLDFLTLPKPLTETSIQYSIEVLQPSAEDVRIRIASSPHWVQVLGDTLITLFGPLQAGTQFMGTIDMVPRVSGMGLLVLHRAPWLAGIKEIHIQWCLDEDGELHYLGIPGYQPMVVSDPPSHIPLPEPFMFVDRDGKQQQHTGPVYNPSRCSVPTITFFDEDSVVLHRSGLPETQAFESNVRIEPPFRMGDTSTITYRLRLAADLADGFELDIQTTGYLVVDSPTAIDYSLVEGQVLDVTLGVVPQAVGQATTVDVWFRGIETDRILLTTVFSEDGTLKYITDRNFGMFDPTKLPQSFPPIDRAKDIQRIVIKSDD